MSYTWDEETFRGLYKTLGVNLTATLDDIKVAYKRRALALHPDRLQKDPSAKEKFQNLRTAYDVLSDPRLRAEYDALLVHRLWAEDYLSRFADLILTAQGITLPVAHEISPAPVAALQLPVLTSQTKVELSQYHI